MAMIRSAVPCQQKILSMASHWLSSILRYISREKLVIRNTGMSGFISFRVRAKSNTVMPPTLYMVSTKS